MKKQLLWCLMLILAGFSSCQKDAFKPALTSSPTPAKVKTNSIDPQNNYADLVLLPRKTGENFDTYSTFFNGVKVLVTGSPSWNTEMYPTLQNGVPTAGAGISADYGQNAFISPIGTYGTSSKTLQEGDAFVIVQGQASFFNAAAFQKDIDDFNFAFDVFVATGASIPFIGDYIKDNYSSGGGVVATPAKLIRVTTGSHWAVATIDYPAPKIVASPASPVFLGGVLDPNNTSITQLMWGFNGKITKGDPDYAKSATGTYVATSNPFIYTVTVTVVRKDGTSFTWTGNTFDLS